jgi:hypothetical protein
MIYNYCRNCDRELELPDGINCEECIIYSQFINDEDEYIIVTEEMAIDAGDRRLEGQLWKWN